jgi:hypothetical protein
MLECVDYILVVLQMTLLWSFWTIIIILYIYYYNYPSKNINENDEIIEKDYSFSDSLHFKIYYFFKKRERSITNFLFFVYIVLVMLITVATVILIRIFKIDGEVTIKFAESMGYLSVIITFLQWYSIQ